MEVLKSALLLILLMSIEICESLGKTPASLQNELKQLDEENENQPLSRVKRQFGFDPYYYGGYRRPIPIPIIVGGGFGFGGFGGRGFGGRGFGGRGFGGRGFGGRGFGGRGFGGGGFGGRGFGGRGGGFGGRGGGFGGRGGGFGGGRGGRG